MPELPEVERVRRSLESRIVGCTVDRVRILRRDVIATPRDPAGGFARNRSARAAERDTKPTRLTSAAMLAGATIDRLDRRGKRLAIIATDGRALDVHLGMTGAVMMVGADDALPNHTHILWTMGTTGRHRATGIRHQTEKSRSEDGLRLVFRDPRRFGGVWTCASVEDLVSRRWSGLGPDALTITASELGEGLAGSRRAIKAALLDQAVLAGVGNIYADEALFLARIHPEAISSELSDPAIEALAAAIREILVAAVAAGGSTIRDFAMPDGSAGSYQSRHAVYGRAGQPCPRCRREMLVGLTVAQRSTTICPRCQGGDPHRVPRKSGQVPKGTEAPLRSLLLKKR